MFVRACVGVCMELWLNLNVQNVLVYRPLFWEEVVLGGAGRSPFPGNIIIGYNLHWRSAACYYPQHCTGDLLTGVYWSLRKQTSSPEGSVGRSPGFL